MCKIRKERLIADTLQLCALFLPYNGAFFRFTVVRRKAGFGKNIVLTLIGYQHIVDIRAECKPKIARQRPRGGCPRQKIGIRRERLRSKGFRRRSAGNGIPRLKADGNRRVVYILIPAQVQLVVRQHRGTAWAIRQNIMPLIQQPLLPQLLHHPPNRLHIRRFHRLIVVIKINPASQPINRMPPLLHIPQHTRPARLIKLCHPILFNISLRIQPQLFFDQIFYRQPMTVPSKPPLNLLSLHRLITRNNILNRTRHKMPEMRQPRCKGRAVKKHVLISPLTLRN